MNQTFRPNSKSVMEIMSKKSLRKLSLGLLSVLVLGFAVTSLQAQTSITTKRASVTFSGNLNIGVVYRNEDFFGATKGEGGFTPGNPPNGTTNIFESFDNTTQIGSTPASDHDELYLDPNLSLRFDIDVEDMVKGVVELRTPFHNQDAGGKNSQATFTSGSTTSRFSDRTLEVKQVYAEIGNFFWEGFSMRAGIQDFKKDLRGNGNSFVIDVSGSENPFDGAETFNSNPGGGRWAASSGFADSLEAAGGLITQTFGTSSDSPTPLLRFDAWAFSIDQRYRSSGLNGPKDKYFLGVSGDLHFGKDGQYGKLMLMVFDLMNGTNSHLLTAGGGIHLFPLGSSNDRVVVWEVFAEAYGQGGEYASNHTAGGDDVDLKEGFAAHGGTKISIPIDIDENRQLRPYLEGSYVEVSGDSDYTDKTSQNFVSLENNNRTLIVENGYYGYDVDTNYRGVRVAAGFDYQISNNIGAIHFEVLYAFFEWQDNGGGRISGGSTESEKLGDELDITIQWIYSSSLQMGIRSGWLLDSKGLGQKSDIHMTLFEVGLTF